MSHFLKPQGNAIKFTVPYELIVYSLFIDPIIAGQLPWRMYDAPETHCIPSNL